MTVANPPSAASEDEREARLRYTEAAALIDKFIRNYSICEEGKRVAWRSARMLQAALDAARLEGVCK